MNAQTQSFKDVTLDPVDYPKSIPYLVIGAGIAGLGAAYELQKAGKEVLILESSDHPGGRMTTKYIDGVQFNVGAGFLLSTYNNILNCAQELGLKQIQLHSGRLIGIRRGTKVFDINPKNVLSAVVFGAVSTFSKLKVFMSFLRLWSQSRKRNIYRLHDSVDIDDESAGDYLERLWGKEAVEYLLDPLIFGPLFHSPYELSKAALLNVLPQIVGAQYLTFEGGLGEFPQILSEGLSVRYRIRVDAIHREEGQVMVSATDLETQKKAEIRADHVIVAVPGDIVLRMLTNPKSSEEHFFSNIHYVSAITVTCSTTSIIPERYNYILVPSIERRRFSSFIPNNQIIKSKHLFTVIISEDHAKVLIQENRVNGGVLIPMIQQEFGPLEDLSIEFINVWPSAIPKITPGYIGRLKSFLDENEKERQVIFCGDAIGGPFTEGAFTSGIEAARKLL